MSTACASTNFFDFAEPHGLALIRVDRGKKKSTQDNWQNLWSKDRAQWEAWLAEGYNLGIHHGASGTAACDVEVGKWEIFADWHRSEFGTEPPRAAHVSSARNGWHLLYRLPGSTDLSKLQFAWGELLVGNNQTVAPPSYFDGTLEGKQSGWYQFFGTAELYDGAPLLKLWKPRAETRVGTAREVPPGFRPIRGTQAAQVLKLACERVSATEKGSGLNDTLNTQALKVGHYVGAGEIGYDVAFGDLYAACLEAGGDNPRKDKGTIERGLRDGMKEPARTAADMFPGVTLVPGLPGPRYLFETLDDLDKLPETKWLIDGWIPEQGVGLLYGEYGHGKSFVLFDWLLHIAYGLPEWHGAKLPGEPRDVLLIAREGASGFRARVRAFKAHHGIAGNTRRIIFMRSPTNIGDAVQFEELKTAVAALNQRFAVVAVDTVGRAMPGEDFNDAKSVTAFMERLQQLGEVNGGGVAIGAHHENKSGDLFGSIYYGASSDFMFRVVRDGGINEPLTRGHIHCTKMKDGEDGWKRRVDYAKEADSLVVASVTETMGLMGAAKPRSAKVNQRLEEAMAALHRAIAEHGEEKPAPIGLSARAVLLDRWRDELFKCGAIEKDAPNPRQDFKRIKDALRDEKRIIIDYEWVWSGGPVPPIPSRPVAL